MIGIVDLDQYLRAVREFVMRDTDLRGFFRQVQTRQFRDLPVDSIQFAFRSDRGLLNWRIQVNQ